MEEAYLLHERTKLAQFYFYTNFKEENAKKLNLYHLSEDEKHVLNYIFFSWKNFINFAKLVFNYKFSISKTRKALKALYYENFHRYMKEIFLPHIDKQIELKKVKADKKQDYYFYLYSNKLINKLVSISKQIFQTKPILTQKNPTLRLDSDCYKLYKVFDDKNNQENAFIDIISLEKNQRIKGIQLSGFKGNLPKKKNFSSTLTLSFDSTDMSFYLHFTFKAFKKSKSKKTANFSNKTIIENKENQTLGMDFGITEKAFLALYLMELLLEINKGKFFLNLIKNQSKKLFTC